MSEELPEHLKELLSFIKGEGPFAWLGKGIHTYPGRGGVKEEKIYAACVDLESRGLVYRFFNEPNHVCFMPTEK